jgi:replicative DNA helicase
LGVPVLVLSQLSRDVERRDDKRPMLSDLRESGAIEQDADSVWFAYREEYYLERSEPKRREGESDQAFMTRQDAYDHRMAACRHIGEIIIAKNRHGPLRTVSLRFNGPRQRFENLAGGQ